MFDVGLSELMVIAVVALVVIGPERLPKVARTAGLILGRLQRYVSDVKADINREIQLDELKQLQRQVTDQVTSLEASVSHEMREVEASVGKVIEPAAEVAGAAQGLAADAPPVPAAEPSPAIDGSVPNTLASASATTETQKS